MMSLIFLEVLTIGKYEVVTCTLTWPWDIYKVTEYQDESYALGRMDYYEMDWAGKRPQSGYFDDLGWWQWKFSEARRRIEALGW